MSAPRNIANLEDFFRLYTLPFANYCESESLTRFQLFVFVVVVGDGEMGGGGLSFLHRQKRPGTVAALGFQRACLET